ncbi:MAG: hypothetical protein M3018_08410 [Actinomycetota bacterium]|nr:hypothetical protein [Actinomycetota bacterium]
MRAKRARCLVLSIVCASVIWPASASGVVTGSIVTVPSSGTWLLDDQVTPHEAITVGGAAVGGTAGDAVDINCYSGASGIVSLATNVGLATNGSFTVTIPQGLRQLAKETCVLRAVPAGDTNAYPPGGASPFTGPRLSIGQVRNTVGGSGQLEYYYLYAAQSTGGFDYRSLGNCPISDSFDYDAVTFGSVPLDACSGGFSSGNSNTAPSRSELRVDGADAYVSGNAFDIAGFHGAGNPGYPAMTYGYSIDPANGNLILNEIDHVVKCSPGGTYPPTGGSCASFVPTGVDVTLHITQDQAGRVATVVQDFASTDGRAHMLDLLVGNQFRAPNHDAELNIPWTGTGPHMYTQPGQVIAGPSAAGPGSVFFKGSASVPDGGEAAAQGSVTFSNPPSSVTVVQPTNSSVAWLELAYSRTVPATGAVALGFNYSDAFYASEVAGYAAAAQAAFRPSVSIISPAFGSSTSRAGATVSGTAFDRTGLATVTVDGRLVAVGPNGSWSGTAPMRPGANNISATAIDVFGNATQAQSSVIFTPRRPRLSAVSQTHRLWREPGGSGGHRPPVGTIFRFSLSKGMQVAFAFTQQRPGRRMGHKCLPLGTGHAHGRRCSLTVTVATMSLPARVRNSFPFDGVVHGRALPPGRYTLVIVADAAGVLSIPRGLAFTIVS